MGVSMPGETYTHGHHRSVLSAHAARTAGDAAAFLLPHLKPGMKMLDFGCGPGTITVGLAEAVSPGGSVIGIDVSRELGDEWAARIEESGLGNLEFRVGDIYAPEFDEGSFDVVYAHQILQHLSDPVGALKSAASLTKIGGLVGVREVDWGTFAVYPQLPLLDEFRRIYDAVALRNGGNPLAGRYLHKWMAATGKLADIRITTSTWTFAEPEGRAWWGDQWSQRVLESDIAVKALEYRIAQRTELEAISQAWQEWKNDPDAVVTFVHFEGLATRTK